MAGPVESFTVAVVAATEEIVPFAIAGSTLVDALVQLQCVIDPDNPLNGIPVGPK
jgi:hypothetical protein